MTPDQIAIIVTQPLTQTGTPLTSDDVATAITDALNRGGSQWLISTIVAFLPALWMMALILHLGRPYILRSLRRMGLRLGADVWWMSYLILRDTVLLLTFALSFIFFNPNLVANMEFPITGPLSTLLLLLAVAVKLSRRADDDVVAYRWTTAFLVLGATLYFIGTVFGIEAADVDYLSGFAGAMTSSSNQGVALGIMWVSLVGVGLVAAWLFLRALNSASRSMAPTLPPDSSQKPQEQIPAV
jgi:small neutral amino acid transporter SnatA (MarC family)